jgi:hypothetical protein
VDLERKMTVSKERVEEHKKARLRELCVYLNDCFTEFLHIMNFDALL